MDIWYMNQEYLKFGDFHIHTNYTDGISTIQEYCTRARSNGLCALGFTEHVRRDLSYDYQLFMYEIKETGSIFPDLVLLPGCEAKVLSSDGDLDLPDVLIDLCEVITGVFHTFEYSDKRAYLRALTAMLENPIVDVWGHPALFHQIHNIRFTIQELCEVVDICIDNHVYIEINEKYPINDIDFLSVAWNRGARFIIGSDAHSVDALLTRKELERKWSELNQMY